MKAIADKENKVPKKLCPYCGGRVIFSNSKEALRIISIRTADDPHAVYFVHCNTCGRKIGFDMTGDQPITGTTA